jgi:sterol desaturase/sphingolipid hydroxylase (fatty acid hydroxylase superfamily)
MFSILLVLVAGFFVGESIGYFIHRMLHSPVSGRLHQAHMTHHQKLYPITDFYSEKYISPGKDNTVFIFGAVLLALTAIMFLFLPIIYAIAISAEFLILGLLNDYLHDIFHIHPNWLEKFSWFQRLRKIHYRHHEDMSKNFGIFTFLADHIFRTFSSDGRRASN